MYWLENCWYQAAWSDELTEGDLLARTFLGEPVVLFRQPGGQIAALLDRCPHRFAPLSAGKLEDGKLVCGYHGLGFSPDGSCVLNPHGRIADTLHTKNYPVLEKHTAIWIWMGDEEKVDEKLVPDLSFIDRTPPQGRIPGYMPTKANYQLVTDNILDLSHADYLHPDTLGGMMTNADFQCEPDGNEMLLSWEARNVLAPGVFKAEIAPPQHGDFLIDVRWQAPAVMVLRIAGKPHGEPIEDDDYSLTLHNMVPENEKATHYFYCATRTTLIDDQAFMAMLKAGLEHSFLNEDKPMLEKQQQRIGDADFWSLKPRTLSIDKGAVWVRRKLESLIAAENA